MLACSEWKVVGWVSNQKRLLKDSTQTLQTALGPSKPRELRPQTPPYEGPGILRPPISTRLPATRALSAPGAEVQLREAQRGVRVLHQGANLRPQLVSDATATCTAGFGRFWDGAMTSGTAAVGLYWTPPPPWEEVQTWIFRKTLSLWGVQNVTDLTGRSRHQADVRAVTRLTRRKRRALTESMEWIWPVEDAIHRPAIGTPLDATFFPGATSSVSGPSSDSISWDPSHGSWSRGRGKVTPVQSIV